MLRIMPPGSLLNPSFVELGYNTIPAKSEGPRMWATIKQKLKINGLTFHLVLIHLTPSHLDRDDMLEEPLETYSQLPQLLLRRIAKEHGQLHYCMDKMSEFTPSQIQKANNQPLDYLSPFLSLFQAYFSRNMHQLRRTHWEWFHHELGGPSITQTERDNLIFTTWNTARSILEDFSVLTDQLEDYATELGWKLSDEAKEASSITQSLVKHRKMLERARNLELHVRYTIQLNVSSLSLRESRRSITQADSVGRITFLAFIFLPLPLITFILRDEYSRADWKWFLMESFSVL
ncbi:hypothetical protein B0J14DRAFT_242249 [Halenospora varia]|nr:hypothetical protein B0J14DRAFT_242249 [Halenospora varia]